MAATVDESILSQIKYEGKIAPNLADKETARYSFKITFPNNKNLSLAEVAKLMTQNQDAIKAADSYVTKVTTAIDASNQEKTITADIKILHTIPDQVQIICALNTTSHDCHMSKIEAMTKKFTDLSESITCNAKQCEFSGQANVKMKMVFFSPLDITISLTKIALARNVILAYFVNANVESSNYLDLSKAIKKSSLFQEQIDNLDDGLEDLFDDLADRKCNAISFRYQNKVRSGTCL